ncbi:MAG: DUF2961 domain-containing protein [Verrucomicrobiae bacterium]|nr:DUF2961 domain-containing protein [Verrucomicrobiae bacterium]
MKPRIAAFLPLVPALALLPVTGCSRPQAPAPGNPLAGIERLKAFEARRESSCDPDWRSGNSDRKPIDPGQTLTLCDLEGPGIIAHIWFTISHPSPFYSRLMTLRVYWDGEEHPSVECPIGDFFGIGHGVDQAFNSLPIRVTSEGRARNCYWPMPFRKRARITVTNDADKPCRSLYYYIDWQKHGSLPPDTAYFHAMYRQEHPAVMGQNYLLADIVGRGHYVGTIQSVYHSSGGWYGEGDDFFFIDGEKEPSLRGTGTEDYFCDAWGFRQQDGPFYGTPLWEGGKPGGRGTAYRFHIPDPVVFRRSLRAEIEHKGSQEFPDGTRSGFIERDDLMSSVAIWYQTEPHKPWPMLPPGPERLPFTEQTVLVGHSARTVARHSEHPLNEQPIRAATDGKQLWFKPTDGKGWLEIPFRLGAETTADFALRMVHSRDYGTYRILIDGKAVGVLDLFNPLSPKHGEDPIGRHTLAAGDHVLRFECVGKNAASQGYFLGFDALMSRVPTYARPAGKDLRQLQAGPKVD